MQGRDLVSTIQTMVLPEEEVLAIFFKKEDFEITEPMFNDEEAYLISDEDWANALEAISSKGIDGIWEQLHEIVGEALHRVYLSKEKA